MCQYVGKCVCLSNSFYVCISMLVSVYVLSARVCLCVFFMILFLYVYVDVRVDVCLRMYSYVMIMYIYPIISYVCESMLACLSARCACF